MQSVKEDNINEDVTESESSNEDIVTRLSIFKKVLFSDAAFPASTAFVAFMTLILIFVDPSFTIKISKKESTQEPLFTYLEKSVREQTFSSDFFETAFNHFDRKHDGKISGYGRTETIEDFIVYLNSLNDSKDLPPESVNGVVELLKLSKETEPFSALPSEERRLMEQLQMNLSDSQDEMTVRILNELKQVLLSRHKEYTRIEAQNAWSLPLSIVGVFLTLVFGVWSTILSVRQNKYKVTKNVVYRLNHSGKVVKV